MATTPTPSPTSATTGVDPDLAALMSDVFADQRAGDPTADDRTDDLWSKLDDLGLARLTTPEEHGGSGADWFAAAELLRAAAAHGVATPYAEHDLLAAHALTAGGLPVDGARRTVARLDATGVAHAVAWARGAERIVVLWRDGVDRVADLASSAVTLTPGANAAGEPRDTVTVADLADLEGTPIAASSVDALHWRGALVRAVQVVGALEGAQALTVEHASGRTQFGRPLARFQAVQHLVADLAAETALARAAVDAAVATVADETVTSPRARLQIAVARSCAGHAASVVVRNAHQVHGAIGTTAEHRLHEFTRPALAWRSEYGSVQHWDDYLTDATLALGPDGLWAAITG